MTSVDGEVTARDAKTAAQNLVDTSEIEDGVSDLAAPGLATHLQVSCGLIGGDPITSQLAEARVSERRPAFASVV
jgi:hypothetical protein